MDGIGKQIILSIPPVFIRLSIPSILPALEEALKMTNAYITLDALKGASALNITGTNHDSRLLSLAEASSRVIDGWCNRHFFVRKATLRFGGGGRETIGVPDLVSVDGGGLRTYDSGNGEFATQWNAADYRLLPADAAPASADNPNSRPYTQILATGTSGGKIRFPRRRDNVEVSGHWGWWLRLRRITQTVAVAADASAMTLTLSAQSADEMQISAGHTLLIGDEQIYVRARAGGALTAERGVNGTTAAAITVDSAIDIYEYPAPVTEAALHLVARMWQGALVGAAAQQAARDGMDADIALLLSSYRKPALGIH